MTILIEDDCRKYFLYNDNAVLLGHLHQFHHLQSASIVA
jgi:hypothetical protein